MNPSGNSSGSVFARLTGAFLGGNLSLLLMVISLLAGAVALSVTPREEEPQIVVPLADVIVRYPGGSAREVEQRVASRLERLLYQIDGVEYVYSMSRPGVAVATVRFYVGQDREKSLIKLYNKIFQNIDRTTPGITGWVVKPVEIDDVPVVNVALYSPRYDAYALTQVAEEVVDKLQHIPESARITLHGARPHTITVHPDVDQMKACSVSPMELVNAIQAANAQSRSGAFDLAGRRIEVETGPFLHSAGDLRNLMLTVYEKRPVYLADVARVEDGPGEVQSYTRIGFGPGQGALPACLKGGGRTYPAVTIAVAKKKGANAVELARRVEATVESLRGSVIPDPVLTRVTRDYGETANEKVNSLVENLLEAIVLVIGLVTLTMNWRVGLIVVLAVPVTYSLTLLVNLLLGYTINRVTLFALILSLGLLVDDPIVGVENIHRHLVLRRLPRLQAILAAMTEVISPVVVATLAIIVAFLPLFFITGMMGPYMRPMAVNVPVAMLCSLLVSVTLTPWLSHRILPRDSGAGHPEGGDATQTGIAALYRRVISPWIASPRAARRLLFIAGGLFAVAVLLPVVGAVPLKMLPFDNKNEFQVLLHMPEGTTLEKTANVAGRIEQYLRTLPEVTDFTTFVGTPSPMDFNGLVRHYYLREGANLADVRVNLLPRSRRVMDSHAIVLRIRNDLARLALQAGARIQILEVPPGPPVLSTIVAEVYGGPSTPYERLIEAAAGVRERMLREPGVVEVDDLVEAPQSKLFFRVDEEKAGLLGVSVQEVVQTMNLALDGMTAGTLHTPADRNELPILLQLPLGQRSDPQRLVSLAVKGQSGRPVEMGELGRFEETRIEPTIYHKNQERVVFVTAEASGRGPAYPVMALQRHFDRQPPAPDVRVRWNGEGEWKITIDAFRDLGIAFGAALVGIFVLLVYETGSYLLPVVIMLSIPLTAIGIMPGFALLNLVAGRTVGGYATPVFFTATAMIGMIALAGIVVRNGIILVDFIRQARGRGADLREAIIQSGAVRFRPIFLTAGAAMLGAWPITMDPIFSGLAWSLIFGLFASTAFTLVVIPVAYYLIFGSQPQPRQEAL